MQHVSPPEELEEGKRGLPHRIEATEEQGLTEAERAPLEGADSGSPIVGLPQRKRSEEQGWCSSH